MIPSLIALIFLNGKVSAQACTALFSPNFGDEYACLGQTQSFSADSVNNTWTYTWSTSGNGTILSGQGTPYITVLWTAQLGGNFVSLSVNTPQLCFDTQFLGDSVYNAVANIAGPQILTICDTSQPHLYHTSVPQCGSNAATATWLVTGGTIVATASGGSACVLHDSVWVKWGAGGIGFLELTVENNLAGCTDRDTVSANLYPDPILSGPWQGCLNDTSGLYYTPFYQGKTYTWSAFGGTPLPAGGFGPNFQTVLWTSTANPYVSVTVSNGVCGVRDTVWPEISSSLPTAAYTYTKSGRTVTYTNNSSVNANTYYWNFGDGFTSTLKNPAHTYATNGNYYVCLISENGCGNDTSCQVINICPAPVAGFQPFQAGALIAFGDTTQYNPTTWYWEFGDGDTSYAQNPTHEYLFPGDYQVCLYVSNACGQDTTCDTVHITCYPPIAKYGYNQLGQTLILYDQATGQPTSYHWTFGDGGTSSVSNPFHPYAVADTYHVCMEVYNLCGADTTCKDIVVPCASPLAGFVWSDSSNTVTFTDNSFNVNTYSWDFGDGFGSTQPSPVHTYQNSGSYTVCLTVTNPCGNNIICKTVTAGCPQAPPITFNPPGPMYACAGDTVVVSATTGYATYNWSTGDNTPTILLTQPGTVTLEVTNSLGCTNIASFESYIGFESVEWSQFVGSSQSNDSLFRTVSGNSWGTSGAVSTQTLAPNTDGTMRHIVHDVNFTYYIGLSENNPDAGPTSIDYSFFIWRNALYVRQFGGTLYNFAAVNIGDILEIRRVGGVIEWLRNGTVLRSVADNPNRALRVDCSIFKQGNYLTATSVDFCTNSSFVPPLSVEFNITHNVCQTGPNGSIVLNVSGGTPPYTYNWSTSDMTSAIYNIPGGLYTVTVSDANSNSQQLYLDVWNRINWVEHVGATSVGDALTRTATGNSWGGSGARSEQVLQPYNQGFMSHVVSDITKYYYVGWSDSNPDAWQTTMDYAFYNAKGTLYIREETGHFQTYGVVAPGDILRIDRFGPNIEYRKNGALLRTTSTDPGKYLFVDCALYTNGFTLKDVFAGNCTSYFPPPLLDITGSVTQESCGNADGGISVTVSGGTPPYSYAWSTSETTASITGKQAGNYSVIVSDNGTYSDTAYFEILNKVNWEGLVAATANGGVVSTTLLSNGPWGASGARSDNKLLGGSSGKMVHEVTSLSHYYYVGLSAEDVDAGPTTMDYSFYNGKGALKIREEATGFNQWISGVSLQLGDKLEIRRINNSIYYYLNGTLLRNVATNGADTLMVDVSIYTAGTVLDKVWVNFCDTVPGMKWNPGGQEGEAALAADPGSDDISVFPNPANTWLTVDFGTLSHDWTGVEILDIFGRQMLWQQNDGQGEAQLTLPLDQFVAGVYFLRVHTPYDYKVRKVEVLRD
ncbi:MAG: PKD domain-containing protein [Bacteroidia bacterium]|nr:PKD domain-containing protein [Bacteroidia bacterium]